ncbi:aldo/keto reductase, partial [Klebsiella quasipneumoniae]
VGRALREMAKREDVVLATKFLPRTAAQIAGGISGKQAITRSLDQSLRNLGMDYIDLYIYHIWDYNTPVIDVLEALHAAVAAGKVRAIGISNCYAWQLAKANALAE